MSLPCIPRVQKPSDRKSPSPARDSNPLNPIRTEIARWSRRKHSNHAEEAGTRTLTEFMSRHRRFGALETAAGAFALATSSTSHLGAATKGNSREILNKYYKIK